MRRDEGLAYCSLVSTPPTLLRGWMVMNVAMTLKPAGPKHHCPTSG